MRWSYGPWALHSVPLQKTQMLSFQSIGHKMIKLYSGQITGRRPPAHPTGRPYAIGDPIIRPVSTGAQKV